MVKRDSQKAPLEPITQTGATEQDCLGHETDSQYASTVVASTAFSPVALTGQQKNKSWAKSLKKATSSIIFMAMPPTSADQLPMVVAQTPMSPDRLPTVPSIAYADSGLLTSAPILTTTAATSSAGLSVAPRSMSLSISSNEFYPSDTSSTLSVASSTVTSSAATSSRRPSVSTESKSARQSKTPSTRTNNGEPRRSSSTMTTPSHAVSSTCISQGEAHEEAISDSSREAARVVKEEHGEFNIISSSPECIPSPPASPPSHTPNTAIDAPLAAITTSLDQSLHIEPKPDEAVSDKLFPSPPPSPNHPHVLSTTEDREDEEKDEQAGEHAKEKAEHSQTTIPVSPPASSSLSTSSQKDQPVVQPKVSNVVIGDLTPTVSIIPTKERPSQALSIDTAISAVTTRPTRVSSHDGLFVASNNGIPAPSSPISSSSPASPSALSALGRKQKQRSMVVDAAGFPTINARSIALSRSLSNARAAILAAKRPKPVQHAPWIWHQDGFHHQRLESHQILTKEQVFEQFHLDLEQDGPNGFFLFKVVKKFKRQDSSLLGITSSLLDEEISASPTSVSPTTPMTPTSILDSIDAVSVSQRLKRQLLLQKRKKQRKASLSSLLTNENEEDENLEALLSMSANNSSLQNLNSSLQEVIDAVDSLKESTDWAGLLDQPHEYTPVKYQEHQKGFRDQTQEFEMAKQHQPDSDGEYTSRDKDAMDVEALERRKGIYATGRLDGTKLISKKRHRALQRRSSTSASTSSRKNSSSLVGANGHVASASHNPDASVQDGSGVELRGSSRKMSSSSVSADTTDPPFKKQAVSQLHIYSRNGLKFKFDVMQDNELHFVEASKKYTFMDPLASHRQPHLDLNERSSGDGSMATTTRVHSNSAPIPSLPTAGKSSTSLGNSTALRNRNDARSKNTMSAIGSVSSGVSSGSNESVSSSGSSSNRRVFVTRLGRHTLLTYPEYKALAKSASSFTLGAKLLLQRSLAAATGSSGGSSKDRDKDNVNNKHAEYTFEMMMQTSPLTATPSSSASETSDYFSSKKRSRSIPGFASKAVAAIKSPSTPVTHGSSAPKTTRAIVTPYNPADYENSALRVSVGTPAATEDSDGGNSIVSPNTPLGENNRATLISTDSLRYEASTQSSSPDYADGSMSTSPPSFNGYLSSSPPSASSSSSFMSTPIRRQGNQAGLKFQHLFATVHQRLQKLELDNGSSFYNSALVQWTVIEDPAELRWWRDKIGIQMIGRLPDDPTPASILSRQNLAGVRQSVDVSTTHSETVRSSYFSTMSTISDASSMGAARPFKNSVSVERLGYRFLRVSGYMGTLKVTVSEQVEARAVALAVRAEMLKQQQQQQTNASRPMSNFGNPPSSSLLSSESSAYPPAWVELSDETEATDDDDRQVPFDSDSDEEKVVKKGTSSDRIKPLCNDYEYDEWTGQTRPLQKSTIDRFSRRKHHDRAREQEQEHGRETKQNNIKLADRQQQHLIERMTMIVGQANVFKGDLYMKNVYKF
ncbi:hypothetical protein BGZ94_001241 [Podila epigama]|nr:hypothetical protein BGZ94_001241 [Podila epigama]